MPGWPTGQYSDDTMLTLALARSIAKHKGVAGGHVIAEFAELWRTGTIVGAGQATSDAVARYLYQHTPWDQCGAPLGNAGNGAAMRAAPIGLWYYDDLEAITPVAVEAGEVTHHDPRAIAAAIAVALLIAHILRSKGLDAGSTLSDIAERVEKIDTGFCDHLLRLTDWMDEPEEEAVKRIIGTGQFGPWKGSWEGKITAYSVPTVLISFYSFFKYQDDFGGAVSRAILTGGDVDTTGAITGALSGALLGFEKIPRHLREGLLDAGKIDEAAVSFYEARFRKY